MMRYSITFAIIFIWRQQEIAKNVLCFVPGSIFLIVCRSIALRIIIGQIRRKIKQLVLWWGIILAVLSGIVLKMFKNRVQILILQNL